MNTPATLVYVVDDDEPFRVAVGRLLRSEGYFVETFASPTQFLPRAAASCPACVVLDLCIPGSSGIELQQQLARAGVNLQILFVTGYGDIPTTVRAMKAGAVDFLTKPVEDEALLAAVEQACARDAAARAPG